MIRLKKKHKTILLIAVIMLGILISGGLFVDLNPEAAANFTDDVLRPILGANTVIAIERVFFNFSDSLNMAKYKFSKPKAPQFNNSQGKVSLLLKPVEGDVKGVQTETTALVLDPINLDYFPLLPGEGQWQKINFSLFPNEIVCASTFIRPDPARSYAITTVVKMKIGALSLGMVAGAQQPGGPIGNKGPGIIPLTIQKSNNLLAAFNGGFQYSDGQYGMVVDNKTYVPLKPNLATLFIHSDGHIEISNYTGGIIPSDITQIRQNGPMLLENSQITTQTNEGAITWGKTVTANMYTWRSGIGITKNGNLVYAVGPSLVPSTLAQALKSAGAVNAMQLDINPFWVRYVIYTPLGNGLYKYDPLVKDMQNGGYTYLHGYGKDFFYVYKK